jgi:glycosyltransferase involved in cell wall biosynthesis
MKKVVAYIISDIEYAIAFEWVADSIDKSRFDLVFVLLQKNPSSTLREILTKKNQRVEWVKNRNGFGRLFSLLELILLLFKLKAKVVHCHMRDANQLGMAAAFCAGVGNRIYTRHYSTQNQVYYPHAVKYDRIINWLATKIVAPSKTVQNTLTNLENVPADKIALIHHGFDLKAFENPDSTKVATLKNKLQITSKGPVVGVIARYLELKGIQYIIPAFTKFLQNEPNAVLILANAHGNFAAQIKQLLAELPTGSYREINFEKDLISLYACFNYFIHVPIDADVEAFGQVYVEALAAGIPSIFTLSGVANEFIEHKKNACVVPHQNSEAILEALMLLNNEPDFAQKLAESGRQSIENFNLYSFIKKTETLYE